MAKKIKAIVKMQIPAAKATPAPPVGTALGPHGINMSEFCQKFNDASKNLIGFTVPVEVKVFEDRTYEFRLKQPPASELIKKAAGIDKGSSEPQKIKVGKITRAQLREIAEKKMPDLNADDVEAAMKIIGGTARNMGVEVEQ